MIQSRTLSRCLGLLLWAAPVACSSSQEPPPDETGGNLDGPIFDGNEEDPDFGVGNGEGGEGLGGGGSCVGQTAGTEALPSVLQLVVDTSGSMDNDAPGSNSSKWVITRRALLDAFEQMSPETALGVVFYPDVSIDEAPRCFDEQADIAIDRLGQRDSRHRNAIQRAFQNQSPDGGTPTHDAYRYAFSELERSDAPGRRFLVVITDGNPTFSLGCVGTGLVSDPVDPSPLVGEAQRASAAGVSTFVIGSPGSEGARESLSRMAQAGGTAAAGCSHDGPNYCHFDMTEERDFAEALSRTLGTISGLTLSCAYDIPEPPGGLTLNPERVNVLFRPGDDTTELIAQNTSSSCDEGWRYSQDGEQILLCENTCDRVQSSLGTLELQFGCETQVR